MSPGTTEQQDPKAPAQEKQPETVTMSRAEAEALRRERDEARESERYWATMARGNGKAPEPAAEPEETLDPNEFVDPEAADIPEGDTPTVPASLIGSPEVALRTACLALANSSAPSPPPLCSC